jgi:hypothetical protein
MEHNKGSHDEWPGWIKVVLEGRIPQLVMRGSDWRSISIMKVQAAGMR